MRIPFVYGASVGVSGCAGAGGLAICWAGFEPQNAPACAFGPRSGPGRRLPGLGRFDNANSWSLSRIEAAARRSTRWPSHFAPLAASSSSAESTRASCFRTRSKRSARKSSATVSVSGGGFCAAGCLRRLAAERSWYSRAFAAVISGPGMGSRCTRKAAGSRGIASGK